MFMVTATSVIQLVNMHNRNLNSLHLSDNTGIFTPEYWLNGLTNKFTPEYGRGTSNFKRGREVNGL